MFMVVTSHQIGAKISWILLGVFCFRFCLNRTITSVLHVKTRCFRQFTVNCWYVFIINQMSSTKCALLCALPVIPASTMVEGHIRGDANQRFRDLSGLP